MPALNYATQYSQALAQAYPYVLHFAALRSTANDARYKWTGANTIQIPSLSTTGRTDGDRDSIGNAKRNFDNAWEPKTLGNFRQWSTLVHPMDIDETNQVASIQNITQVFNEEQKFPEMDAYLVSKLYAEWTGADMTADTTEITEDNILQIFDGYMIRNDNKISFHYAVDDTQVVQAISEDRNAWHAGDGANGVGNRFGIGVEICYSLSGGERFEKAERNAARFLAERLYARGWGVDRLRKHQDFSDKYCPHRTLDLGWPRFVAMVQAELDALDSGFVDVPMNTWYTNAVIWAAGTGIASGVDDEHFAPDMTCTRAQALTFLWRAMGKPEVEQYGVFGDVPANAYYVDAVNWAYWMSVANGVGGDSFGPDEPCTRGQVITFLWRALGRSEPGVIDSDIRDVPEDSYFYRAVHWALEKGITAGTDNHHFEPYEPCTRAQIVTMLWRAFKA